MTNKIVKNIFFHECVEIVKIRRKRNSIRTAINFIGAVGAVGAMVTLAARFQTRPAVGAAELVQVTGRHVGGESASSLVSAISAVEKSVALLLRRQANSARAFEIFALTAPVA
jgi:hypothetical protein